VAQPVGHPTLGFGSGHDLRVVGLRPAWGSMLSEDSVWDSLSLFLCPTPPLKINKSLKRKKIGESLDE